MAAGQRVGAILVTPARCAVGADQPVADGERPSGRISGVERFVRRERIGVLAHAASPGRQPTQQVLRCSSERRFCATYGFRGRRSAR